MGKEVGEEGGLVPVQCGGQAGGQSIQRVFGGRGGSLGAMNVPTTAADLCSYVVEHR